MIGSEAFVRMVCGWMREVFEGVVRMSENFVLVYCPCFCVGLECEGNTQLPWVLAEHLTQQVPPSCAC